MTPRNLSLLGLFITLAATISYFLLPLLGVRASAAPFMVLAVVGMAICIWGVTQKRGWLSIGSLCVSLFFGLGLILTLTVLMRLPQPGQVASTIQKFPDVSLPNQNGTPVRLASYQGKGPVLLVFYRGFW